MRDAARYNGKLDTGSAEFEFRDLAEGIELRVGQEIGSGPSRRSRCGQG
jgi:hypothetical protein